MEAKEREGLEKAKVAYLEQIREYLSSELENVEREVVKLGAERKYFFHYREEPR